MGSDFLSFLIYLFYGMAFFAIGVSITSSDTRASNLKIARSLWLFALFAYSHAFHEWFELYQYLHPLPFSDRIAPTVFSLKLLLVLVSFAFLLAFGVRVLQLTFPTKQKIITFIPLPLLIFLITIAYSHMLDFNVENYDFINARIRNLIGLPGALTAGCGLIFYSRTVTDVSAKGARNFFGAGLALLVYGLLTGVVPSGATIFEAPIELFRGLSAFLILHFVMHALYVFDEERRLLIEERLVRFAKAEKLHSLGKLAFGIAHEINNPLANVSLNVEMLQADVEMLPNREQLQKRFAIIERNLDRASKIARELLSFASEKDVEFIPVSLNEVLESTLELLGARRKNYQFMTDFSACGKVSGIPWKLEEVFLNLFVNAMDATEENGTINLRTRQLNHQVMVEISDSGCGIPAEKLNKVLDPFFTTKEVGQGTGLGLSICYGIMEQHGGTLELNSEEGKGTAVTLCFPQEAGSNG